MAKNEEVKRIGIVGFTEEAALLTLYLSNSEAEIIFFNLIGSNPSSSIDEVLHKKTDLLYSNEFVNQIKLQPFDNYQQLLPTFDWLVISPDASDWDKTKELLYNLVPDFSTPVPITVVSISQSFKVPANVVPVSLKPFFLSIRFFEPIKKCELVEIVPLPETNDEILKKTNRFCEVKLGKTALDNAKSGFADRLICFIQIWSMRTGLNLCLDLEQINFLTGKIIGWTGKGVVKYIDQEGPENFYTKSKNLFQDSILSEEKDSFIFLNLLVMPSKGYYLESDLIFDPLKGRYVKLKKKKIKGISKYQNIDLKKRLPLMMDGSTIVHQFYQEFWRGLIRYVSHLIEKKECSIYGVEQVTKEILGWEMGLMEIWEALDIKKMLRRIEILGGQRDSWINKMVENGYSSFFETSNDQTAFYDISTEQFVRSIEKNNFKNAHFTTTVWENKGVSLYEMGDNVLNLEIHTYRNIIDEEVGQGILNAIDEAEKRKYGLILSAKGNDFTIGANLGMVFFAAIEKNYKLINYYLRSFQEITHRIKESTIPIAIAPKGLTIGGGCEMLLHCDGSVALLESYIGLPEAKAGLLPSGGGTKEMAIKMIKEKASVNDYFEVLINLTLGKVSKSAYEATQLKYVNNNTDFINSRHLQLSSGKDMLIKLLDNYQLQQEISFPIGGKSLYFQLSDLIDNTDNLLSSFDKKIAKHIALVLSGGKHKEGHLVNEQHFLDLEREGFLSLCGEKETLKRLKNILSGKRK